MNVKLNMVWGRCADSATSALILSEEKERCGWGCPQVPSGPHQGDSPGVVGWLDLDVLSADALHKLT